MLGRRSPLLFPLALAVAGGCYHSEAYRVDAADLARARSLAAGPGPEVILPARRAKDDRPVELRLATITAAPTAPSGLVTVETRALHPQATAGSLMTWIGSGASVVASAIFFFAANLDLSRPLGLTSAIFALSAEPPMIAGTVLWILGLQRQRPAEVPPGKDGYRRLAPAPPPTVAPTTTGPEQAP